jgi:hypothetical protein
MALIIDQSRIRDLISRPGETLNVEIKRWIDPQQDVGIATIVKACFAIRNRNGGFLVVGFDDKTLQPDSSNRPQDIRATFHVDDVQAIISRFALEPFEIGVGFEQRDGNEHVIIVIPEGVTTPAVVKRDLTPTLGTILLSRGAVYFRTLNANGTPSSAQARPEDWREILEICFDNREADIGRFLRRHLTGSAFATALEMLDAARSPPPPTLRERAQNLLLDGQQRFEQAVSKRSLKAEEKPLLDAILWSSALVVDPERPGVIADQAYLTAVMSSNPNLSGWPPWIDSRWLSDQNSRPVAIDDGFESLIVAAKPAAWRARLDFWRVDPSGKLFLLRTLQDDTVPEMVTPGVALDPFLTVIRVAEAIAVGLSIAKVGWAAAELGFAFRWTKLKGRRLEGWAYPLETTLMGLSEAHDDEVETFVALPLDTPISAITPFVDEATRRLFARFNGYRMAPAEIEKWVRRLIERKLG